MPNAFVCPPFSGVGHKQCAMLFRRFVSRNAAGSGRAVLEGVGLSHEAIQMCYKNSSQDEEEAIQSGLMKWRDGSGDSPTWEVLIDAMGYAKIGVQHIQEMKEDLLKGAVCQLIGQNCSLTICVIGFERRTHLHPRYAWEYCDSLTFYIVGNAIHPAF